MHNPQVKNVSSLEFVQGGGMASIYKGHHLQFGEVAVKIPRPECSLRRFKRELELSLAIGEHPQVVQTLDGNIGTSYSDTYMVMEWVDFPTLGDVLEPSSGPQITLPWNLVASIAFHTCIALQCAYTNANIRAHRDIKPNNIFVDIREGQLCALKLADFGIAAISERSKMTGRVILGRPEYMAPERTNINMAHLIDQRSDIYSLGAVMYECLSGSAPYSGMDAMAILVATLRDPIREISSICSGLDKGCANLIMKCLSKSTNSRYKNVGQLAEAIRDIADVQMLEGSRVDSAVLAPVTQVSISKAFDIINDQTPIEITAGEKLPQYNTQPKKEPSGLTGIIVLILGIGLIVISITVFGSDGIIGAVVGGLILVLGFVKFLFDLAKISTRPPANSATFYSGNDDNSDFAVAGVDYVRDNQVSGDIAADYSVDQTGNGGFQYDSNNSQSHNAKALLIVVSGNLMQSEFFLHGYDVTCGRRYGVDIQLPQDDLDASRVHANILFDNGVYVLKNCSQNGTLINGQRIYESIFINTGDLIQIGQTSLRFEQL